MRNRWIAALSVAGMIGVGPGAAFAAAPQAAQGADCAADDVACRLNAIDERLARIERLLRRGGDGAGQGVSIAVNLYCRRNQCATIASEACVNAGFARGAIDEVQDLEPYPRIIRAICFE